MSAPIAEFNSHSSLIIAATILITAVAGYLCSLAAIPEYLSGAVSGGAALVPGSIAYSRWKAARGRATDVRALSRGRLERPIGIVVTLTAVVLFIADSLVGFVFGTAVDLTIGVVGGTLEQILTAAALVFLILAVPTFLAVSLWICTRAAHYLWPTPFRWLALAVAGYLVLRAIVSIAYVFGSGLSSQLDPVGAVLGVVGVALLVLLVAWFASMIAKRSHVRFVAGRLFRKLSPDDKATVLNLLSDAVGSGPVDQER